MSLANKTILVVDDEKTVAKAVQMIMESEHCKVLVAYSAEEALRVYSDSAKKIAAVIMDITMPLVSGETLAASLRNLNPKLPIVYMTGYDAQELKTNPPAEVVQKPFVITDLLDAVKRAVLK